MPKKVNRIIIDTNIWISFLLSRDYSKLDKIFSDKLLILLFSHELLEEFVEVSQRPKFKKYFSLQDLQDLLVKIRDQSEFIKINRVVTICRDPKDNFLLALAKAGKANYLITGDKDLLNIKSFGKTKIITIAEFLTLSLF